MTFFKNAINGISGIVFYEIKNLKSGNATFYTEIMSLRPWSKCYSHSKYHIKVT